MHSDLALWAYTSPTTDAYPLLVREVGAAIEGLEFTTVAPGGFGDLACVLKLPDARRRLPELEMFSRVCLRDGPFTAFAGEWSEPALVLDGQHGEYLLLAALGAGAALRDDPDDAAYSGQTARAILSAEVTRRGGYLPLDADVSAVLPDAPATLFSPVFDGLHLEEVLHEICGALGDYIWAVWDHPTHTDRAGFPTWQLVAHARDTTTTRYLALEEDIVSWHVTPSARRAYNVVQVAYVDPTSGPATVTVSDPRLAPGGGQGGAPFRRRKLRRSLGTLPLTAAQATAIAQAWLASYRDPSHVVEVQLTAIRDANGRALPLHQVRADGCLFLPQLAAHGPLSAVPTPGSNQFWIAESIYRASATGEPRLTLHLDHSADRAATLLARLHLAEDARLRRRGVYRAVQSAGAQQVGYCSVRAPSVAAGQRIGVGVSFVPVLTRAPSGLAFASITSTNVASGPEVTPGTLTPYGCEVTVTAAATGAAVWTGTYTTIGA